MLLRLSLVPIFSLLANTNALQDMPSHQKDQADNRKIVMEALPERGFFRNKRKCKEIALDELQTAKEDVPTREEDLNRLQKLANNENEQVDKRIEAVLAIFRKHVYKEMSLQELSGVLKGAKWLDSSGLGYHPGVIGSVPVEFDLGKDSIWDIHILSFARGGRTYLWLSLRGFPSTGLLEKALKGEFSEEATKKIKLKDCAAQTENGKVLFRIGKKIK